MHGAIDEKVQSYPSKFIQQTHLLASYYIGSSHYASDQVKIFPTKKDS
jgi:hypothetical protein